MSDLPYDPGAFGPALAADLARYELDRYLDHGGFGLIYVFKHRELEGLNLAVKLLRPELTDEYENIREAFRREVTLLAGCTHPNVIKIHDIGSVDLHVETRDYQQVPYYVMDFLDGYRQIDKHIQENLDSITRNGLLLIFRQILSGVAHIHDRGIFHNDLKEANIFVSEDGVLVADFGWAKKLGRDGTDRVSRVGSPDYLDPEILEIGQRREDLQNPSKTCWMIPREEYLEKGRKWDLYALGIMLDRVVDRVLELDRRKLSARDADYLKHVCDRLKSHRHGYGYGDARQAIDALDKCFQTFGTELLVPELAAFPVRSRRIPPELSVPFSDRVGLLLDHPWMRRLERIRQLGMAYRIYEGAMHHRLEHSIGVFAATIEYTQALLSGSESPHFRSSMSAQDLDTLFAAALLHDVGHVPFSHAFEGLKAVPGHNTLSTEIISGDLDDLLSLDGDTDKYRPIQKLLEEDWGVSHQDVLAVLSSKHRAKNIEDDNLGVLRDILSGPVDADKMDYLRRDSVHVGVPYGLQLDKARFLQSLVVHPTLHDRLALLEKGRIGADQFIQMRYQMYSEVYWYHEVRAYEAMLVAAVEREFGREESSRDFLRLLLNSSDDEILETLAASNDPGVRELIRRISHRERHRVVVQFQSRHDPNTADALVNLRWKQPLTQFLSFMDALRERLSVLIHEDVEWWQVVVDVPDPDRYRINTLDVLLHGRNDPVPLSEVSFVWKSVQEDFRDWVQQTRVFLDPVLRQRVDLSDTSDIQKAVDHAVKSTPTVPVE